MTGVPANVRDAVCARYAARGLLVAAADVDGAETEAGLATVHAAMQALRANARSNGRVAVAGYGAGGRFAYLAATRLGADAAVAFYATGIGRHIDEAERVRVPLSLHFGDDDDNVPFAEVRRIKGALEGIASVQIYRYPGVGAGFALLGEPGYAAAAALEAERRALRVLVDSGPVQC